MDMGKMREAMAACLRMQDKLLLCCTGTQVQALAAAVREVGAVPVAWEPDLRWQNLVRLAILNRTRAAVGPAAVLLALSKLGKATAAPIPVRDAILVGPACPEWMKDSIASGLDARVWDCCEAIQTERDLSLETLGQELLRWSSVLDYRVARTEMGLSLELIVFPGKQLPKLPSGGKVTVRAWIPGADVPLSMEKY